jgi:acyl carrier protein
MQNESVSKKEVATRIRELLQNSLFVSRECLDGDLIDGNVIDSAGFMELFVHLENEFSICIEASDLSLEHFRTVESIAAFIVAKTERAASTEFVTSRP